MTRTINCNIYSGVVLERQFYHISAHVKNTGTYNPLAPKRAKNEAQKEKARDRQSLMRFVRMVNATFDTRSLFVTLTFDDAHLPCSYAALRKIRKRYIRRLRSKFPDLVKVSVMGRGETTGRFHLHLIIAGVDEATICEKWTGGMVKRVEPLRANNIYNDIDHGQDFTGLATYLWRHYEPEQGKGKRWFQTKNVCQPERDTPKLADEGYSENNAPPAPDGYMLVEFTECDTPGGKYRCFKYVLIPSPCRTRTMPRFRTFTPTVCRMNC